MAYSHTEIESKWQKAWDEANAFRAVLDRSKPKFYALDMFPYPSGAGLHAGHLASYTPADVISRYKRAKGFNVLHPMGYDAFGLPAEQYAIQTGIHPAITTEKAIQSFRAVLKAFGFSFDWEREISTCDPSYYKWTQAIFLKLFERGLAYQKEVPVNWCPELRTVLANEEVVDGKSERGGHPVVRMPMKQWMLKITDYAERLLKDLDTIDWPQRTKEGQANWIGRSDGARVRFKLAGLAHELEIFTTRPDTLFGVTFMVLAPEHPLVSELTTDAQRSAVESYKQVSSRKSEIDRKAALEKTGVATGGFAIHPFTGEKIPIWIADYVMMDYGTGAIMAVPGHDTRDFEFASKFGLPILRVLESEGELPFEGEGTLVNSQFLNGLSKPEAITKMIETLEQKGIGTKQTQYKLRDWLFSRQRYWGEPFPIVHYPGKGARGVDLSELPVELPKVADYQPSEKGEAPLARNQDWVRYRDAKTQEEGMRETDTMPGSAGSSWYFLRYTDPTNDKAMFSKEAQDYWMPVDLYIGGPEHTVGHLLYSRFWQKVLFDAGLVSHSEPFKKLAHQGMILGSDGEKMSKSRGNTVPAEVLKEKYGADATRMYILFMGPMDRDKPWSDTGIEGVRRFIDRVWRLCIGPQDEVLANEAQPTEEQMRSLHKTIKKVTEDIESMSFNTAISAMMIFINEMYKTELRPLAVLRPFVQIIAPFAPHIAEELWFRLRGNGLCCQASWPSFDPALAKDDQITMAVQVNGKTRGTIEVTEQTLEAEAIQLAKAVSTVQNAIGNGQILKVIYKPGKILNLIVK